MRTFLIIFAIMTSSALFFSSSAISDTMLRMYEDRYRKFFGSSEIIIYGNNKSPTPYLNIGKFKAFSNDTEYIEGVFETSALYSPNRNETVYISLVGADISTYQRMNPITFKSNTNLYPFEGKKIIISKTIAQKYSLSLGDSMELEVNGFRYKFYVSAICYPQGLFMDDGFSVHAIVPKETLSALYGERGKNTIILIKPKTGQNSNRLIEKISEEFKQYTVRESISLEEIKQNTKRLSLILTIVSTIVSIMSVFIIYTTSKVIVMEKLPFMSIFRSIGAEKRVVNIILILENTFYGVVGGILGCGLGIVILYIIALNSMYMGSSEFDIAIQFTPIQLIGAFLFALLLSLVSCIIPILQISNIAIKDMILRTSQDHQGVSRLRLLFGMVFIVSSLVIPIVNFLRFKLIVDIFCVILCAFGIILLIPYIVNIYVNILKKIYTFVFGNEGVLAVKNLRGNKNIFSNISLLTIGVSCLLMINTVDYSVIKEITNIYRGALFDVWITYIDDGDRNTLLRIQRVEGVEDVSGINEVRNIKIIDNSRNEIRSIQGVDCSKFNDFWDLNIYKQEEILERLNKGRNIILSETLKEKFKVEEGDFIILKMPRGNKAYKVVGSFHTVRNNGSIAFVSQRYLKADGAVNQYSNIYVKTYKDPQRIVETIQNQLRNRSLSINTVEEMERLDKESNRSFYNILRGFFIITMGISVFGIFNNLIMNYMERKRYLAMYRAVGMSKDQMLKMIFIEALSSGLIGGFTGILTGFIMMWQIRYVIGALGQSINIRFPLVSLHYYIIIGVLIVVTASIIPAVKSSKLNIIESIKYE